MKIFILGINSCYNNTQCGKHGQCQNLIRKYKCICHFMYTGKHCEKCKIICLIDVKNEY
jgi:hypothetical protein